MNDDDELCLCFHVTRRKVKNFIRIHHPRVASQVSECGGAGTGCGWCRAMIGRLVAQAQGANDTEPWPEADEYAVGRQKHLKEQAGPAPES